MAQPLRLIARAMATASKAVREETNKANSLATLINVHAKPGARQSQVTSIEEDVVSVQIAAPAREGEANKTLIEFMADVVGVRKGSVSLVAGQRARDKVVRVENVHASDVVNLLLLNMKK